MHKALSILAAAAALFLFTASALPPAAQCAEGRCTVRLTASQLLGTAEKLVLERRYEEARPLLAALGRAPDLKVEHDFLQGYVAVETGDLGNGVKYFRSVLKSRPELTRARLELARALMLQGKDKAADYHYRLAEEDGELPPEIARTVYAARSLIRSREVWHLNLNLGIAPDTNINNGTADRTVDLIFGNTSLPFTLDENARRRSGLGQTASLSSGIRLRMSDGLAMTVDIDSRMINYQGKAADDISTLLAAGPELTLKDGTSIGIAATGSQRWYGGQVAQRGYGGRLTVQKNLDHGQRLGLQVDAQRIESHLSPSYDGDQLSAYVTYERVIQRSLVATATVYGRKEDLRTESLSSTEIGVFLGLGGELPWGLNAGASAGIARSRYDAPMLPFSTDRRKDWRLNGRAYLGARSLRWLGFSPSLTYNYNQADSNIGFYDTARHRVEFAFARYF